MVRGFPGNSDGKESSCNLEYLGLICGLGRSPGEGHGNPLQYSCLGNSMNRGAWQATVHGVTESRTWLNEFHFTPWQTPCRFLPCHTSYLSLLCSGCSQRYWKTEWETPTPPLPPSCHHFCCVSSHSSPFIHPRRWLRKLLFLGVFMNVPPSKSSDLFSKAIVFWLLPLTAVFTEVISDLWLNWLT